MLLYIIIQKTNSHEVCYIILIDDGFCLTIIIQTEIKYKHIPLMLDSSLNNNNIDRENPHNNLSNQLPY